MGEYYEYIANELRSLGNMSMELKEMITSKMLVSKFGIPAEIALLAVKGVEAMQVEAFKKQLESVSDYLIKVIAG